MSKVTDRWTDRLEDTWKDGREKTGDPKRPNGARNILRHLPTIDSASLYWGLSGSPNTAPFNFSIGTALFIKPPNLPLLLMRSPSLVRMVGQCVNLTIFNRKWYPYTPDLMFWNNDTGLYLHTQTKIYLSCIYPSHWPNTQ